MPVLCNTSIVRDWMHTSDLRKFPAVSSGFLFHKRELCCIICKMEWRWTLPRVEWYGDSCSATDEGISEKIFRVPSRNRTYEPAGCSKRWATTPAELTRFFFCKEGKNQGSCFVQPRSQDLSLDYGLGTRLCFLWSFWHGEKTGNLLREMPVKRGINLYRNKCPMWPHRRKLIIGSLSKDDSKGNDGARKQWSDWLNEEK